MTCKACGQPIDSPTGIRLHPGCDVDVDVAVADVFATIRHGLLNQPRSAQRMIGPSEIGQPCDRRIGYRLAQVPRVQQPEPAWLPFIGTSVHEQLADILARAEVARFADDAEASPRWHVEERVTVGTVNGVEITGSCDLFDEQYGIVYDHKIVSRNRIREHFRPHGPGQQYVQQAHLYGKGFANAGHDVRHVAIMFWTRDGGFDDRYVWTEPFDMAVADAALERLAGIDALLSELGPEVTLPLLATAESYCANCPWFHRGANDPARSCPGVPRDNKPREPFASLT